VLLVAGLLAEIVWLPVGVPASIIGYSLALENREIGFLYSKNQKYLQSIRRNNKFI
jgi:hypothetical protein